jgi:hypothetical protein
MQTFIAHRHEFWLSPPCRRHRKLRVEEIGSVQVISERAFWLWPQELILHSRHFFLQTDVFLVTNRE